MHQEHMKNADSKIFLVVFFFKDLLLVKKKKKREKQKIISVNVFFTRTFFLQENGYT